MWSTRPTDAINVLDTSALNALSLDAEPISTDACNHIKEVMLGRNESASAGERERDAGKRVEYESILLSQWSLFDLKGRGEWEVKKYGELRWNNEIRRFLLKCSCTGCSSIIHRMSIKMWPIHGKPFLWGVDSEPHNTLLCIVGVSKHLKKLVITTKVQMDSQTDTGV